MSAWDRPGWKGRSREIRSAGRVAVSSSSSATEGAAERLARGAARALAAEAPWHGAALARALGTVKVACAIDGERFGLFADSGGLQVGPPPPRADLELTTSLASVRSILDGDHTALDSVRSGALDLRGSAADLGRAGRAWAAGLHGLVRAPSAQTLLDELYAATPFAPRRGHAR